MTDQLRENLLKMLYECVGKNMTPQIVGNELIIDIKQGNIADYLIEGGVEIPVRCKECTQFDPITDSYGRCLKKDCIMVNTGYCSDGYREEG